MQDTKIFLSGFVNRWLVFPRMFSVAPFGMCVYVGDGGTVSFEVPDFLQRESWKSYILRQSEYICLQTWETVEMTMNEEKLSSFVPTNLVKEYCK